MEKKVMDIAQILDAIEEIEKNFPPNMSVVLTFKEVDEVGFDKFAKQEGLKTLENWDFKRLKVSKRLQFRPKKSKHKFIFIT